MDIIILLGIGLLIKALFGISEWWKSLNPPKVKLYFSWVNYHEAKDFVASRKLKA